eukprot:1293941-Rhodomonas_salina.2
MDARHRVLLKRFELPLESLLVVGRASGGESERPEEHATQSRDPASAWETFLVSSSSDKMVSGVAFAVWLNNYASPAIDPLQFLWVW